MHITCVLCSVVHWEEIMHTTPFISVSCMCVLIAFDSKVRADIIVRMTTPGPPKYEL